MHSTQVYLLKLSNWTYQSGQQLTQGECLPSASRVKTGMPLGYITIYGVPSISLFNQFRYKPEQEPQLLLREGLMLCSVDTSTTLAEVWFTETRHSV